MNRNQKRKLRYNKEKVGVICKRCGHKEKRHISVADKYELCFNCETYLKELAFVRRLPTCACGNATMEPSGVCLKCQTDEDDYRVRAIDTSENCLSY